MSQSHSGNYLDYMDGVPVKISEKYKPPPIINLPYGVTESPARASELLRSVDYDFELENKVLKKLIEWQNIRETIRNERNHRLQLLEEARQRELDLKADTENEEKLKQLSVSEVSYPSTEEISEISPDDNEDSKQLESSNTSHTLYSKDANVTLPCQMNIYENYVDSNSDNIYTEVNSISNVYTSSNKNLDNGKVEICGNILQPVPVSPHKSTAPTNLLDDPDPIRQFQQTLAGHSQHKFFIKPLLKNNLDNLTFSDFENDTSSPFDNMELKTINDLELLAQVLNTSQASTVQAPYQDNAGGTITLGQQPPNGSSNELLYSNMHSANRDIYSSQFPTLQNNLSTIMPSYSYGNTCVPLSNGYYNSGGKLLGYPSGNLADANTYYASDYSYHANPPTYQCSTNINSYSQNTNNVQYEGQTDQNTDIGSNKYQREDINMMDQPLTNDYSVYNVGYPAQVYQPSVYNASYLPVNQQEIQHEKLKTEPEESKLSMGSRSRSVPDIVRELDEEVAVARQRARERSHNCSPALRPPAIASTTNAKESKSENLPNPFDDLSPPLQIMCKHISSMGFPLDRVARACRDIGKNDKKVVEYLLFMGELMDLGFSESNVGAALLKHNCNRDKALDDLIS